MTTTITTSDDAETRLDTSKLKELAQQKLVEHLISVNGAKSLIIDPALSNQLSLLVEISLLKNHGVERIFWLEKTPPSVSSSLSNPSSSSSSGPGGAKVALFYLLRPTMENIKLVAGHVLAHQQAQFQASATALSPTKSQSQALPPAAAAAQGQKPSYSYKLLFSPHESALTNALLESAGVKGSVECLSWDMGFIPLEDDLVSLERDSAFRELWVDEDPTPLHITLPALTALTQLYGPIPRITGKGVHAHRFARMFIHHLSTLPSTSHFSSPSASSSSKRSHHSSLHGETSIDGLFIIDRKVDLVTPLLTQLTYEGLVDELMGIKNSHVEVPPSLLAPATAPAPGSASSSTSAAAAAAGVAAVSGTGASGSGATVVEKMKKHHLKSATDPLLPQLRDLNFSHVGRTLSRIARRLDQDYKSRFQAKTVPQLKEFVGKLGGLQSEHQALKLHTGLTEMMTPSTHTEVFNASLEIQQNLLTSYSPAAQLSAIENLIYAEAPLNTILRLICLASLTSGGIKAKVLEGLKRELLQTYGYQHLPTLLSLQSPSLGLVTPLPQPTGATPLFPHAQIRKGLRLLVDNEDLPSNNPASSSGGDDEDLDVLLNMSDISYVYSIWAPLSIRLLQCVTQKGGVMASPSYPAGGGAAGPSGGGGKKKGVILPAQPLSGWKGFEDVVSAVPGETFDIVLPIGEAGGATGLGGGAKHPNTTTIVFFLGGITYTEIAAIRWMARQSKGRKYLIATTGIISGNSIMDAIGGVGSVGAGGTAAKS